MGRFGGPWGVRGWLHLRSFTDPPDNLLKYRPWLVEGPGGWRRGDWQPLPVSAVEVHGDGYVAHMVGFDDREEASGRFRGAHIAVPAATLPLPAENEFYWRDLLGLRVLTTEGVELGHVRRLLETGANDVLLVREHASEAKPRSGNEVGDGKERRPKERLIPFVEQFVVRVDLPAGRVVVDWDPEF